MVYSSEIFPGAWRPSGVAFSFSAVPFWDLIWTGVAAPAFANIGWYVIPPSRYLVISDTYEPSGDFTWYSPQ